MSRIHCMLSQSSIRCQHAPCAVLIWKRKRYLVRSFLSCILIASQIGRRNQLYSLHTSKIGRWSLRCRHNSLECTQTRGVHLWRHTTPFIPNFTHCMLSKVTLADNWLYGDPYASFRKTRFVDTLLCYEHYLSFRRTRLERYAVQRIRKGGKRGVLVTADWLEIAKQG